MSLTTELERARGLDIADLADAIESIGFECTRCGACCTKEVDEEGEVEPHTATVFPDEVRTLQEAAGGGGGGENGDAGGDEDDENREWRDVARPMPYGLSEGEAGEEGETFEWALQTDACGDCAFYAEEDGRGVCTVHEDRPLICETYPFSVALDGTAEPAGAPVDSEGVVRAHECEGLGRDISREEAEELAAALKERAIRELEEAIALRENYEPVEAGSGEVVVHDSEGAKRPDGTPVE
ncbi:YkgJ family cysteine cluster protein [Halolamina salifodinae]|uniref:Fe-S-cluster containining protein n=1 Tax=Halolamina salifodinae TaxID=1202767 RepID=A0A8T4H0Q2_9EURY|nr:YkgJ family cysteine cluster protein [Halolamina salifodinae]MBP1987943.1 Fe-S-cluster containining protein [Halolamina salifodinae]